MTILGSIGSFLSGGGGQAVAGIASALGGLLGGSHAIKTQYKYQSKLQQQQQDWLAQMSNTAHQREVADLRAAGLNPILSADGGQGASTPSSGMGQINAPDYGSSVREGIATALQFGQAKANIKNTEAQTKTEIERAEVFKQDRQIKMFTAMIEEAKANTANERIKAELDNLEADTITKYIGASARQIDAESNRITAEANRTNAETNSKWTPAKIGAGIAAGVGSTIIGATLGKAKLPAKVAKYARKFIK